MWGEGKSRIWHALNPEPLVRPYYTPLLHALNPEPLARQPRIDLIRAPYVLYGVKYIDLVSLAVSNATLALASYAHIVNQHKLHVKMAYGIRQYSSLAPFVS